MKRVEQRAAVHAALGDPTRLQVVDLLTVSDLSASEVGARLGIASNLLAHHLRTLEGVGLITRRTSEGDRRRSYLRLIPAVLESVGSPPLAPPDRVVFVCTANSARSHLAAALWRKTSTIPAASAGTHPAAAIHPGAVAVAIRRSLPLPRRRPRSADEVLADGDLIVTVCDRAHEDLRGVTGLHWSVPDPVGLGTEAAFDAAFDELAARVTAIEPILRTA